MPRLFASACVALLVAIAVACSRTTEAPAPASTPPVAGEVAATAVAAPAADTATPDVTATATPGTDGPAAEMPGGSAAAPAGPVPASGPSDALTEALALAREVGPPVVVLDPGHGGDEVGAAAHGVVEKTSNLEIALRVEAILERAGLRVLLTRRDDTRAIPPPGFEARRGQRPARVDLQARIDLANLSGAAAFVSIHSNGHGDPSLRGIETYYNPNHPRGAEGLTLAGLVQSRTVQSLAAAGFGVVDRGVMNAECVYSRGGTCRSIFVISEPRVTRLADVRDPVAAGFLPGEEVISSRATEMPAALVELLFVSNAQDAALLQDEAARQAMAEGVARGILDFLVAQGVWSR